MPAFYEQKLKQEYGADSDVPYKVMNKQGYMHGSKETAKGAALQAKHDSQEKAGTAEDEQDDDSSPSLKGLKRAASSQSAY